MDHASDDKLSSLIYNMRFHALISYGFASQTPQIYVSLGLHFQLGGCAIPVATLSLFRFSGALNRAFVISQMALARFALSRARQPLFWKLCGSGTGEGFTPKPNWGVWGILAVWPDEFSAREGVAQMPVWQRWRARSEEDWHLIMQPVSAKGSWAGVNPFLPDPGNRPQTGKIAVLTRATLRPRHVLQFWKRVPNISHAIGQNLDVDFKIGIGEMPFLHQVTFSVWPDAPAMARFAHADGPHARAIKDVRAGDWFAEELYARFRVLGTIGSWGGRDPIATDERRDAA
jgi:spheroidene monooxygenase